MAHEVETMVSASGITAWHGLGKVLEGTMTSAVALKESGLDWTVRLEELQVANPEWRNADSPVPAVAIVRSSDMKVLGASGLGYRPVQNSTLFAVGETLMEAGARWETAGALYDGRRVWALLRTEDSTFEREVAAGDKLRTYLLLANAHDGLRCAELCLTTVRVVCANTFRLARMSAGAGLLRFRHSKNVELRVQQAAEILMHAKERMDEFVKTAQALNLKRISKDSQVKLLAEAIGVKLDKEGHADGARAAKKLDVAIACLEAERAAAETPDSAWIAFNAVTRFTTHQARFLGDASKQAEKRLDGTIWGPNANVADKALALAQAV